MKNLLRAFLLACGLAQSASSFALAPYEGPQDVVVTTIIVPGSGFAGAGCPAGTYTWAAFKVCVNAMPSSYSTTTTYGFASSGSTMRYAWSTDPVQGGTVYECSGGTPGVGACGPGTIGTVLLTCSSTNREVGLLSGVAKCVSKCYSLRGASVSAFVPIDDPAATVLGACLFISGKGQCQLEAVDTSNYTYGSQLYRGGTWDHVGQGCNEDPTDAPSTGALNTSPTGGTGSGSGGSTTAVLGPTDAANLAGVNANTAALKAGQCGGEGQPKCAINEGNAQESSDNMTLNIEDQIAASSAAMDAQAAAIDLGAAPSFLSGSRWLPSVTSLFPGSSCTYDLGPMNLSFALIGGGSISVPRVIDVCPWADYARAFLYWAFGVITLVSVWSILFRSA